MSDDPFDDPEIRSFLEEADRNLRPRVETSAVGMSILNGKVDPKLAIELGYILLLGKPLILVVMPGTQVPDGLVRAATAIVEWSDEKDVLSARIMEVLDELMPQGSVED